MKKVLLISHSLSDLVRAYEDGASEWYDNSFKLRLLEQELSTTIKNGKTYKIKFTNKYWDIHRLSQELSRCEFAAGLYDIGQKTTGLIGYQKAMEICQEVKPYDIKLEITDEEE